MSYADYCDLEYSQFYAETFPVARKSHRCCECAQHIQPGERYLSCRGATCGDGFWFDSQCLNCRDFCMEIRDHMMDGQSCLPFGGLDDFLCEHYRDIICDLKAWNRKKYARIRSHFARYYWYQERDRMPFWQLKKRPHRRVEMESSEWNLKRGFEAL